MIKHMKRRAIIALGLLILILIMAAAFGIKKIRENRREQANRPTPASNYPQPTPLSSAKPSDKEAAGKLSDVKVAIVYEKLNDARPKRTIDEQLKILKETDTDLIFRASWRWQPYPEKCSDLPKEQQKPCENGGASYEMEKNMIAEIKKQKPSTIIVAALPAQKIAKVERNEVTGERLDESRTWAMALDPEIWGLSASKEEFQEKMTKSQQGFTGHYPDITDPDFQKLFLSWAEKQIDIGVETIWIDLLYSQAGNFYKMTKDYNHSAVKESYDAATKMVDEIHKYGESKGKNVYVGSWTSTMYYPYPAPKLDFVTVAPTPEEVQSGKFDEKGWNDKKEKIKETFGNVPIIAFFDWGYKGSQIETFVGLDKEERENVLRKADKFFTEKGMIFAYPVHGGYISIDPRWYDAMDSNVDVYDIIKELANKKSNQ